MIFVTVTSHNNNNNHLSIQRARDAATPEKNEESVHHRSERAKIEVDVEGRENLAPVPVVMKKVCLLSCNSLDEFFF